MSTYSFETTPEQETALAWVFTQANAERIMQKKAPYPDHQAFLTDLWRVACENYIKQRKERDHRLLEERYEAATADVRQQVRTLLGLS